MNKQWHIVRYKDGSCWSSPIKRYRAYGTMDGIRKAHKEKYMRDQTIIEIHIDY